MSKDDEQSPGLLGDIESTAKKTGEVAVDAAIIAAGVLTAGTGSAAIKGGEAAAKGAKAAKGGEAAAKGGEAAAKGGEAAAKGGEAAADGERAKKAADNLRNAESRASDARSMLDGSRSSTPEEEDDDDDDDSGFINNTGEPIPSKAKGVAVILTLITVLAFAIIGLLASLPTLIMATIDYGLQLALGFEGTSAILEEQAEYVVAHQLKRGYFNDNLAADFEKHGVEVGQVTLAGEFVRTNNYSAELDAEIASDGIFYDNATGELAMRFEGEVIRADDFVAKVESNPRLYMAYMRATDMTARFYFSNVVNKVFKEFGLSRDNFGDWEPTGTIEGDQKQFEGMFNAIIEKVASAGLNGKDLDYEERKAAWDACIEKAKTKEEEAACGEEPVDRSFTTERDSVEGGGGALAEMIGSQVQGEQATEKAVSLLNTVISANEPYIAAGTFIALGEGLNRARIDGDGPVTPLLNTLSQINTVTVTNAENGENESVTKSIARTGNFVAAVLDHSFETVDARNYSRDRVLDMTIGAPVDIINKTTMAEDDDDRFNILIRMKEDGGSELEEVRKASNSLSKTFYDDVYETTKTAIGGNRIPMGGSFLSNNINSRVLSAAPSDAETVLTYKAEIDTVLARRAEAERATLSPFDINSKNTFLGSLVHKFGALAVQNFANSGTSAGFGAFNSIADLFKESVRDLTSNTVLADAEESFLTTNGYCPVSVTAAEVVADIYCTTHNTIDTSMMGVSKEEFEGMLGEAIGEIRDLYMARQTTVGIQDAVICEKWKQDYGGLAGKIASLLYGLLYERDPLHNACESPIKILESWFEVPPEIAIGSKYTISGFNSYKEIMQIFSAYTLRDQVSALLDEKKSDTAIWWEEYEAEHPQDNSRAGILARRSGLSKADVELALGYADYLDYLARYNPLERYAFVKVEPVEFSIDILVEDKDFYDMLALMTRRSLYRDLRNSVTFSA